MKPNILSLLACSSALSLAIAAPSHALLPPGTNDLLQIGVSKIDKSPNPGEESPQQNRRSVEVQIQQLSQQNFGCTCANCLAATKQMVKEGILSL